MTKKTIASAIRTNGMNGFAREIGSGSFGKRVPTAIPTKNSPIACVSTKTTNSKKLYKNNTPKVIFNSI